MIIVQQKCKFCTLNYHFHQKQNVTLFYEKQGDSTLFGNIDIKSKVNQYEIRFQYETNIFLTLISLHHRN